MQHSVRIARHVAPSVVNVVSAADVVVAVASADRAAIWLRAALPQAPRPCANNGCRWAKPPPRTQRRICRKRRSQRQRLATSTKPEHRTTCRAKVVAVSAAPAIAAAAIALIAPARKAHRASCLPRRKLQPSCPVRK